jgi:CelD/BcsL family acetyltransferase involved in cellulose biosynthesis
MDEPTPTAAVAQPAPGEAVIVDPAADPLWAQLVGNRESSVFQSPEWARVLAGTYDFPLRARVLLGGDGVPRAGISYAEIADFLDPRLSSLPFSDFCDPVAADTDSWHGLVDDLLTRSWRMDLRCMDNEIPATDDRFTVVGRAAWHGADLQREIDDIWASLHSSARRAIRKADSVGVTVDTATTQEELSAFFQLHLRVRKHKYGLLAQPFRFFEHIWNEFIDRDRGFVLLAHLDGQVVGGILFLEWQDTLYYKFNASQLSTLPARPNDRLIWEGIQKGKSRGMRLLDFGLSDLEQDGLVRYKRKYATVEKTITRLRHTPTGAPSESDREGRQMLTDLTALLVHEDVPDELTARSGDLLYRYFS